MEDMCNVDTFGRTEATKSTVRDQILSPDHWWMMKLTPPTHVAVISSISFILYFVLSSGRSISSWVALLCSGAFAIFNNAKNATNSTNMSIMSPADTSSIKRQEVFTKHVSSSERLGRWDREASLRWRLRGECSPSRGVVARTRVAPCGAVWGIRYIPVYLVVETKVTMMWPVT